MRHIAENLQWNIEADQLRGYGKKLNQIFLFLNLKKKKKKPMGMLQFPLF